VIRVLTEISEEWKTGKSNLNHTTQVTEIFQLLEIAPAPRKVFTVLFHPFSKRRVLDYSSNEHGC